MYDTNDMRSYDSLNGYKLFILLMSWFILSVPATTFSREKNIHNLPMSAVKGVLDISDWKSGTQNHIRMDGEWEFYWNSLLSPEDFSRDKRDKISCYFTVPGLWNKQGNIDGCKRYPRDGYATLRLTVINIPTDKYPIYIRIQEIPTAYKLWCNSKLISENGTPGTNKNQSTPWFQPITVSITEKTDTIIFTMQISNFHHKDSGIWESLEMGYGKDFSQKGNKLMLFDMLLFGSLLIMGFYHLVLFALRPSETSQLYFGLFALFIGCRSLMVGQRITFMVFPDMSWVVQQKLEYLFLYLSLPAFYQFSQHLFPEEISKRLSTPLYFFTLVITLIVLVTPATFFALTALVFQIILFIISLYVIYALIIAIKKKREGSLLFMCGFITLFLIMINDTLYTHMIIRTRSLAHLGVFLFIFFHSFLLSRKFSAAFTKVKEITNELKHKNHELMQMDKLKNDFLANTSHELRTPLHGIMGLASSMLDVDRETLTPKQLQNLSMISSSSQRLYNMINDLLDFSKIRNKNIDLDLKPVDLKSITEMILTLANPMISSKHVTLTSEISEDLPNVIADENRLQQILFNLVGNAISFTPSGKIIIRACHKENKIEVMVSDTGIGIKKQDRKRIFNEFEQADGSMDRPFPGTGLGLAISRKLVELHGSTLVLKSEIGMGSEFSFSLPVTHSTIDNTGMRMEINNRWVAGHDKLSGLRAPVQDPVLHMYSDHDLEDSKTILIVDDEAVNLQLIINYLSPFTQFKLRTASDGYEALDMIEDEHPDLILLDIMMPGLSGFEVCRKIRKKHGLHSLPVIMLSARNQISDLVQGLKHGANDYLPKPFFKEELVARVNTHLKAGDSVRQIRENRALEKEMERRKEVERELRSSQRHLARILDCSEDAIIVVDENRMISFFNQGAEKLFGYTTNEAMNQSITLLLTDKAVEMYRELSRNHKPDDLHQTHKILNIHAQKNNHKQFHVNLYISRFYQGSNQFETLIIRPVEKSKPLSENIQALETTFSNIPEYLGQPDRDNISDLRMSNPALDNTSNRVPENKQNRELRQLLVKTMCSSLKLWENTTGQTKIDLAEKSGIWNVYLDRGTWKTRTLDKYTNLKTLPGKPRWREVMKTANYVLTNCGKDSSEAKELDMLIKQTELKLSMEFS